MDPSVIDEFYLFEEPEETSDDFDEYHYDLVDLFKLTERI